MKEKYLNILSGKYCWMSGEELTEMVEYEDFQWIWGVFSAFPSSVGVNDVLKYDLPIPDRSEGLWKNPISIQHSLAEIEIIAWDSTATIVICKNDVVAELIEEKNRFAEDLEKYNI